MLYVYHESEFFIIQLFKSIYDITTGDEDCGLTMATAHLGTLNSFITSYLERVQLFFAAKQVPTFLSIVGPATYAILRDLFAPALPAILRDLFAPALPSSVTLADIFECLKEPKRATIVERYHFYKRDQLEGETATQYDAAHSQHTVNSDYLKEAFAIGLFAAELFNDDCSQRRNSHSQKLWTLPFQWRQLRKILAPSKVMIHQLRNSIDLVHTRPHSNPATDVGRPTMHCKFKDAICHACGHIAPVCRSMPATNT